ncbi:MAG: hypothetical protein ABJD55_00530, partial [Flavobacteriaceae bacterium]
MKAKLEAQRECLLKVPKILVQSSGFYEFDLDINKKEKIWIVAAGKGALKITRSLSKKYREQIEDGLVISQDSEFISEKIQIFL